jgi:hypothetical protein
LLAQKSQDSLLVALMVDVGCSRRSVEARLVVVPGLGIQQNVAATDKASKKDDGGVEEVG